MIEPLLAFSGLFLSAFFSGSEIAFVQANPLQLNVWEKQGLVSAQKISLYLAKPERFFIIILIGTNLANVLTSTYATITLLRLGIPNFWTVIIISAFILIFGEIIPKTIFREYANNMVLKITPFIRMAELLLSPFVTLIQNYSRILALVDSVPASGILNREDLKVLFEEKIEISEEFEEDEKKVISKIFDFGTRPVFTAMTKQPDIVGITADYSIKDAIQVMSDTGLSKLPIYEETLNNISGVIFLHDLFLRPDTITSITKPPLFIAESLPANRALELLKRYQSSIAIVIGSNGNSVGLVTVEDLVEELFGEFEDVFDQAGRKITTVHDGSLVIDSLVEVTKLRKRYGFQIPEGNYETIGGFLLSRLGRIPQAGEMLDFDTFRIKILLSTPRRLKRLHLIKKS